MREQTLPDGALPGEDESTVPVEINRTPDFEEPYLALTPPHCPPDRPHVAARASLSGAAAKRRLLASLRRGGELRPVSVVEGAEHDYDAGYWLQRPQRENTVSGEVQEAVALSAQVLDGLYPGWQFLIDPELLDVTSINGDILDQLYGDYERGKRILEEWLDDDVRRPLGEAGALAGFSPGFIVCDKDQRGLADDLCELYWSLEIQRRR